MVVGITGGIGSGKSTVVNLFSNYKDIVIYLADDEAKNLMNSSKEIKEQLIKEFSSEVYINKRLNREYLANIVFKDKEKLALLNAIVHPMVHKHFNEFLNIHKDKAIILYENAILFENNSDILCDKIITVTAPTDLKLKRVIERDNTTVEQVKTRMNNQWKDDKKVMSSNYVIENIGLQDTKKQVEYIYQVLKK